LFGHTLKLGALKAEMVSEQVGLGMEEQAVEAP